MSRNASSLALIGPDGSTTGAPLAAPSPEPSTAFAPAPSPGQTVERPAPGLARGRWEAPAWIFYAVAAAALLGAAAWLAMFLRGLVRGAR